ncbi:MAG: hypothetical protein ABH834_06080 [Candidatus Altiarchaeota archaeon]
MKTRALSVLVFVLLAGFSSALSIGAGPSSLEFLDVNQGGYSEKTLVVYTDGEENLTVKVEATGAIAEWITLNETLFVLEAGGRKEILGALNPPLTVPGGVYNGKIHFYAGLESEVGNKTTFPVKGGTSILATVRVTGEKQYRYRVDAISVKDVEIGYPIKINISLTNNGNIAVVPQFKINVLNEIRDETILSVNYSDSEVQPTTTRHLQVQLENISLKPDVYWLDLTWDLGGSQSISLEVLEKGALALYGKITAFKLDKNIVQQEDTVRIDSTFSNVGEEFIETAILKVEIYSTTDKSITNELEDVVESEPYSVPVGRIVNITSYYKPVNEGRYLVRGYIVYSGKITGVLEAELEVFEKARSYLVHYILLGVVFIIIVYYLIRRKPKEHLDPATRKFRKDWGDYIEIE